MGEKKCSRVHTKYQPTNDEFKCPKCGSTPEDEDGFFLEPAECYDSRYEEVECALLHVDDTCSCYKCGYGVSGKGLAANLVRKKNLIPCSHCKGTGYVTKEG